MGLLWTLFTLYLLISAKKYADNQKEIEAAQAKAEVFRERIKNYEAYDKVKICMLMNKIMPATEKVLKMEYERVTFTLLMEDCMALIEKDPSSSISASDKEDIDAIRREFEL